MFTVLLSLGCTWISDADQAARLDLDADGTPGTVDCDDQDAAINPGAAEVAYDGVDQNCDGADLTDVDGDGADAEASGGADCNDDDAGIYPAATEICGDGVDQDCDGGAGSCALPESLDVTTDALSLNGDDDDDAAGVDLTSVGDADGDGADDLLVGVSRDSSGAAYAGTVYLIPGPITSSGTIADVASLALTGSQTDAGFGRAIALLGDANGDGADDYAIGEPTYDSEVGADVGRVHFIAGPLSRGTIDVEEAATDSYSGLQIGGQYGFSLAGGRDLDGVGGPDIAIGEPGEIDGVFGTILIDEWAREHVGFAGEIGAWLPSTRLGYAVAVADTDGDGATDLVAGTPRDSTDNPQAGSVDVVRGPIEGRSYVMDVATSVLGVAAGDEVGTALCALGDVDGDGREDVAAGAPLAGDTDAGAVYLLLGRLTPLGSMTAADLQLTGVDGALLGRSLASIGDADGDGGADLLIGAPGQGDEAGAGYVVPLGGRGVQAVETVGVRIDGGNPGDGVGTDVSAGGDLDQDGFPDFLLGAPGDDANGIDAGRLYLFSGYGGL